MLLSTSITHWLHWDSWISALLKLLFNENRLPFCISTCICFPILTFLYSLIVNLYRLPLSCKSTLHAFFICLLDKLPLRVVLDLNSSTADCKIFQCRKASKEVGLGKKRGFEETVSIQYRRFSRTQGQKVTKKTIRKV